MTRSVTYRRGDLAHLEAVSPMLASVSFDFDVSGTLSGIRTANDYGQWVPLAYCRGRPLAALARRAALVLG